MTQLSTLIQGSGKNAIDKRSYIATSGQTAFAVIYSPPYVDVYQNGVRLNVVDYTATSGTSITLTVGAAVNDEIEVIGFSSDASIVVNYNTGITPPAVPIEGMLWYDTTDGSLYIRTGGFWVEASQAGATQGIQGIQGIAGSGVLISGITVTDASYNNTDDTAVSLTGGYIKVTGTGFVSGCTIVVGNVIATSVTFISSTEVRAQLPALAAGTYVLYVSNPSGAVAIRVNAITFSALPTWVSTSPLPNGKLNTAISIQLSGTSDSSVTYALQSGSTLPAGVTISSSGLLSGTVTGITVETTYNFTVVATDVELQDSPKAFSITITVLYAIARSLRLRASASAYLNRTFATAGNQRTWTWSGWVKRGTLGQTYRNLFGTTGGVNDGTYASLCFGGYGVADNLGFQGWNSGYKVTTQVFRDPAAWYHIVLAVDTTLATAANRVLLYVNGVQVTSFAYTVDPAQNATLPINSAAAYQIGQDLNNNSVGYFDGELTEINFVDGQALTPASFGQVSVTSGAWVPNAYAGTYGTNGFFLKFADNSANTAAAIGKDSSGNNNNWTPNNISLTAGSTYDSLLDSPVPSSATVGNYAVLNPLANSNGTLSNGNLTMTGPSAAWGTRLSTIGVTSGKWYFEVAITGGSGSYGYEVGITQRVALTADIAADSIGYAYYDGGSKYSNGVGSAYGAAFTSGGLIGVAFDATAGTLTFYKDNVSQGVAFSSLPSGTWFLGLSCYGTGGVATINFGQRPFAYTPPTDFLALNTFNLPASAVPNPATAMAATTYTGTGATLAVSNAVNTVSFQPDLVWIKNRSGANSHQLVDSIRGVTKYLFSDATAADDTRTDQVTAFSASGFSLSAVVVNTAVNNTANNYVAWQWKAGGVVSANNNTAGTITSTVSANQAAGFSIVTYTGTGANATVGHGLGAAPAMIFSKFRGSNVADSGFWGVYHVGLTSAAYFLKLNTNDAQISASTVWNSTAPANTVYSIGTASSTNALAGGSYVAYCWAPVAGYSAFGKYTGNGSADGPFIYTGFKPRYVMAKRIDSAYSWWINDSSRDTYNPEGKELAADLTSGESADSPTFDFLSNGFKLRTSLYPGLNASGGTYIYAAFAESAFNFATAR